MQSRNVPLQPRRRQCVLICWCRRNGDGLWWRPTCSRDSRPELIRTMSESVFLPARSSTWASGPTGGRQAVSAPAFGLQFGRIDDGFRDALKSGPGARFNCPAM